MVNSGMEAGMFEDMVHNSRALRCKVVEINE
jgi:hypothetical protein